MRREADTASGGAGTATRGLRSALSSSLMGRVDKMPQMAGATMSQDQTIQRILELSADAQIARRGYAKDSPAFHTLTGAIAAYGKVLTLLVALQTAGKNSRQLIDRLEVPQSESDPQTASPSPFTSSWLKHTPVWSSN